MQGSAYGLILLLLVAGAASAAPQGVEFTTPAQASGQAVVEGLSRVQLIFPPGESASFAIQGGAGTATNYTVETATSSQPTVGQQELPVADSSSTMEVQDLVGLKVDGDQWASLWLEGNIRLAFSGRADLVSKPDGASMGRFISAIDEEQQAVRFHPLPDRYPYFFADTGHLAQVEVQATDLTRLEWFAATPSCNKPPCPDGGGAASSTTLLPMDWRVERRTMSFIDFSPTSASLQGFGRGAFLVAGGLAPELRLTGELRLPLALSSCAACVQADNETMKLAGNFTLSNIRDNGDGRMRAGLDGAGTVRLDESTLAPWGESAILVGAGAAVAAGVAFIFKVLATFLFSRQLEAPLRHERRSILYGVVLSNPGATYRQVCQLAGIPRGAARYHLGVLAKAGLIVERRHGATVRYFENHGKYDKSWQSVATLRNPELETLHAWLGRHPGSPQGAIVAAMEDQGWSRSTTQYRLGRLVDSSMIVQEKQGRVMRYWQNTPRKGQ